MLNKEIFIITTGQVIGLIGSFLFIKIISEATSVSEYGLYSIVLSIVSLLALVPFSSFDQAIARFLSEYKQLDNYITHTFVIYLMTIIVVFTVLMAFLFFTQFDMFSFLSSIKSEILLFAVLNIVRNFLLNLENFKRNRLVVTYSKIFEAIFKILMIYIFYIFYNVNAKVIINVINLIFFINILYLIIIYKNLFNIKLLKIHTLKKILQDILLFSSPLLTWTLFSWFTMNAPIWVLQNNFNTEAVGHYSMIYNLASLFPVQLTAILSAYYSPIYYQNESKIQGYTKKSISRTIKLLTFIFFLFGIILYNFSNELILLISSNKYLEYEWMIIFLYANSAIISLAQFLSIEIFVYKETKKLIIANIVPALVMSLSIVIVPKYGMFGLVFTLILSSISYITLILLQLNRINKKKVEND